MARLDGYGLKYHIVELPDGADLKAIEKWLNEEVGDENDIVDVELVINENGVTENYTYVRHWAWMQLDKKLHNLVPSNLVGFCREEDAVLCRMVWG